MVTACKRLLLFQRHGKLSSSTRKEECFCVVVEQKVECEELILTARPRVRLQQEAGYLLAIVDAETLKNVVLHSVATAFARSVLPQPGGPKRRTPAGLLKPTFWKSSWFFMKEALLAEGITGRKLAGNLQSLGQSHPVVPQILLPTHSDWLGS